MAGTVRLYVTSTLANNLHRSPSQRACRGGMYGLVGVYGRPGPLAGLLACFLSHVHLAPVLPFSLFSRKRRLSLLAYRTFALALSAPFLSLSLSRYPSLPFLSLACSRRIVALYLLLEAFAFSVFGWWDSDIDEGGGGERESQQQQQQQQQQKGGSFCLLDT